MVYKIWQILKPFAGTFHRAQTLKLGGVMVYVYSNEIKKNQIQILARYFLDVFYVSSHIRSNSFN